MLYVEVDGVDRTSRIQFNGSLRIQDNINQQRDTLSFEVKRAPSDSWYPEKFQEVIVEYGGSDATRIFGGVITRVERGIESVNLAVFKCEAIDWSFVMDRKLVTERYTNDYVSDIIGNLLTTYAPDFTMAGVVGDLRISTISFNGIKISECLEKLAQVTGYSWYVDAYKDIHFFPKNEEPAPFGLTDTSGNYVWESLWVTDDMTQLKNSVLVKGGDIEGNEITEEFTATGTDDERRLYKTAHKIARMPVVTVNASPVTVGVEFLNDDDDFVAMWDFAQKYVRFTDGNIPDDADVIAITGIPLYKLVGRLNNSESIEEHGIYEFKIDDGNIRSQDEMLSRAEAELEAYKNGVTEGEFTTYEPGLRSGQVITVNSALRGVNEDFLIQSVDFEMRSPTDDGMWKIRLATLRTVGIIEFLQRMLRNNGDSEGENELLLSFYNFDDELSIADSFTLPVAVTSPPYKYYSGTPTGDIGKWNFSTWA